MSPSVESTRKRRILHLLGTLFVGAGLFLASTQLVRSVHDLVFQRVDQAVPFLALSPELPSLPLPESQPVAATHQQGNAKQLGRTDTASPTDLIAFATPTPSPLPPFRLQIPALDMDWPVMPSKPVLADSSREEEIWEWGIIDSAVTYLPTSSRPGQGGNVILFGHNNTKGQVFRFLPDVHLGDTIIVHTPLGTYYYQVDEKLVVPYRADPAAGEALLTYYYGDFDGERLTLVSCYPYWTNADRILVIASPASLTLAEGSGGQP